LTSDQKNIFFKEFRNNPWSNSCWNGGFGFQSYGEYHDYKTENNLTTHGVWEGVGEKGFTKPYCHQSGGNSWTILGSQGSERSKPTWQGSGGFLMQPDWSEGERMRSNFQGSGASWTDLV
jgi:hypothetical protein